MMIWIWISRKTDSRFSTTRTHVSVKIIMDTIISSRIKLLRLFDIVVRSWLSIALDKTIRLKAQLWM